MKIGTITFWDTEDNYGQVLQCYALISFLESMGHSAYLVRTNPTPKKKVGIVHKLFTLLFLLLHPRSLTALKRKRNGMKISMSKAPFIDRGFSRFKEENIPCTDVIYNYDDLLKKPLDVDALICGSDQIWSTMDPLMFLQIPGRFKRISYSASFGGVKMVNLLDWMQIKSWLKTFDYISVRESDGIEICNRMRLKADVLPDPTLLLKREEYCSLADIEKRDVSEPYILLYLLGNEMDVDINNIFEFAKDKQLGVKYVASQGQYDKYDKVFPSIPEWLFLIKNAQAVITNSFHGTVFSLIFNTPFLTIPLSGSAKRMNGRINDLLSRFHLENRIYTGDLNRVLEHVDFSSFNSTRRSDIEYVHRLLENILK